MSPPRLLSLLGLTLALTLPAAHGQRYLLRDGTVLNAADVRLASGALVQEITLPGGGSGERRYALANIVRLDFPEPPEIAEAATLVAAGKGAEAVEKIEPLYRLFAPFPAIPGSWWTEAATLRLQGLLAQPAADGIQTAARELMGAATDPEAIGTAKLALAQLDARANRPELAQVMIDQIIQEAPPGVRARAWILRGDLALARNAYEEALEAYLRVPAFFGTQDRLMPPALLGAARAYKGFGDTDRADRSYLDLIDTYPDTSQAAVARRETGF